MKIRYLETAQYGMTWMRSYYRKNTQLDKKKAMLALQQAEKSISEFPYASEQYEDFEAIREHQILGTAFSLLYTVAQNTVWIIDVRDTRGHRSAEALRHYIGELKRKYDIS